MTLSIKKLHSLLNAKGFFPVRYYTIHGQYYIVDTISIKNGESVLLYIPEKYKIEISGEKEFLQSFLHFKIKKVTLGISANIVDRYGNHLEPDNFYQDIDLQDNSIDSKNIESMLEENYNHSISLNKSEHSELCDIRNTYKQLNRLKNCVKFVSYKLGIFTEKYVCLTNEKNEIDCYYIKHSQNPINSKKKLFVIISLENLITSENDIETDVKTIYSGIQTLLEKNQSHHTHKFTQFLQRKDEIYNGLQQLQHFNARSIDMSAKYGALINTINREEKPLMEKYESLKRQYKNPTSGVREDLIKNKAFSDLEQELEIVGEKKDRAREKILELQDYISDVTLKVDDILFDNIVLLNTIHGNIDKLQKIFLE